MNVYFEKVFLFLNVVMEVCCCLFFIRGVCFFRLLNDNFLSGEVLLVLGVFLICGVSLKYGYIYFLCV